MDIEEKKIAVTVAAELVDSHDSNKFYTKEEDSSLSFDDQRQRVVDHITGKNTDNDAADILDSAGFEFILDKISTMSLDEALEILREAIDYHRDDFNFPVHTLERIQMLVQGFEHSDLDRDTYELEVRIEAALMKFHSPYPEVRAVCDPTDDPTLPVETIRAYVLGTIWVAIGAFINQVFAERQPSLSLDSTVIQLLVYPCGMLLARILPDKGFTFRGTRHSLNPGPWNYKEQMLVTVTVNVGASWSNFMGYVLTMRLDRFYGLKWANFGFAFLMNFSTQFFGFGLAGLLRSTCVWPSKAVWPTVLPTLALNRALLMPEKKRSINGWTISRYKFFFILFVASFVYFWIPNVLFNALSVFNWITWISPQNKVLAIITGSGLGLGFNPITTFDWSVISYSKPLVVPFFATVNRFFGMILGGLLIIGMYWQNQRWTAYIPVNTSAVYASNGLKYNMSKIINDDYTLNHEKYEAYSPPYMSIGKLVYSGASYASYTGCVVYIVFTEWTVIKEAVVDGYKAIRYRSASSYGRFNDPMTQLMKAYPEVPNWWFACILLLSFAFGIIACTVYPTTTPVWSLIVIMLISACMMIPTALVFAVTGYILRMSDLSVILSGYMVKENGIANMLCRVYGYNTDDRAESFTSDQKLGHYAKLPPRALFRAQLWGTFIQTFITIAGVEFLINGVDDICSLTQSQKFICSFPNTLFSDSLLYGVVGPVRTFNQTYPVLKYSFLMGAVFMLPFIALRKWGPRKYVRNIHPIVILNGLTSWGSTYNLSYYIPGVYAAYVFMYYIRRRYLAWWTKYNYILTSGLTAGVAFSAIIIFCSVTITETKISWWGNNVVTAGIDGAKVATLRTLAEGETFGLPVGHFH
ncbi:OPT oligopeptide transporter protein-domain-containing protein [Kockiozyma suomiensis]|uniref:OPT oligopeptide transporter protein-domain-containing protein n=1 Tax=Kockiozyma suomiensis TaxID=1337062 RepID=UPI003342ED00